MSLGHNKGYTVEKCNGGKHEVHNPLHGFKMKKSNLIKATKEKDNLSKKIIKNHSPQFLTIIL